VWIIIVNFVFCEFLLERGLLVELRLRILWDRIVNVIKVGYSGILHYDEGGDVEQVT